jgi:hypothetical protein
MNHGGTMGSNIGTISLTENVGERFDCVPIGVEKCTSFSEVPGHVWKELSFLISNGCVYRRPGTLLYELTHFPDFRTEERITGFKGEQRT